MRLPWKYFSNHLHPSNWTISQCEVAAWQQLWCDNEAPPCETPQGWDGTSGRGRSCRTGRCAPLFHGFFAIGLEREKVSEQKHKAASSWGRGREGGSFGNSLPSAESLLHPLARCFAARLTLQSSNSAVRSFGVKEWMLVAPSSMRSALSKVLLSTFPDSQHHCHMFSGPPCFPIIPLWWGLPHHMDAGRSWVSNVSLT